MGAGTAVFLFLTLFQLAVISVLLPRRIDGRQGPVLFLAALLFVNVLLSGIAVLESAVGERYLDAIYVIDGPSGFIIIGYVLARAGMTRSAGVAVAAAASVLLLGLARPDLVMNGASYFLLVPTPYYVGLALLVATAVRGNAVDRWIALAFLPRALLFATQLIVRTIQLEFSLAELPNSLLVLGLTGASVYAAWALLQHRPGPPASVVISALLIGPADALAWFLMGPEASRVATTLFNYLTFTLVRPFLLGVGIAPGTMPRTLAVAVASTVVALAVYGATPFLGITVGSGAVLALSAGSFAMLAFESGRVRTPAPDPRPETVPVLPREASRPQWEVLLLALYRADAHVEGPPREAWTQGGLAAKTGISVKRVSEFPEQLNATSLERLDAHVAGWRGEASGEAPTLVRTQKGRIAGIRGVRVYYRLTPLGARLAEALAPGLQGPVAPAAEPSSPPST